MNDLLTKIVIGIVALALAFASGRYLTPAEIQEKEVIKEVIKEVVKTEKEYITRETKRPDGTVIKEVIVTDKKEIAKEQSKEESKEKIVKNEKPNYKASVIPKYSFETKQITYSGSIEKRIFGPVFSGIYIDPSKKEIGIPITLEF